MPCKTRRRRRERQRKRSSSRRRSGSMSTIRSKSWKRSRSKRSRSSRRRSESRSWSWSCRSSTSRSSRAEAGAAGRVTGMENAIYYAKWKTLEEPRRSTGQEGLCRQTHSDMVSSRQTNIQRGVKSAEGERKRDSHSRNRTMHVIIEPTITAQLADINIIQFLFNSVQQTQ